MTGVTDPIGLAGIAAGMVGVDVGCSTRREKSKLDYAHDEINNAKINIIFSLHKQNSSL